MAFILGVSLSVCAGSSIADVVASLSYIQSDIENGDASSALSRLGEASIAASIIEAEISRVKANIA